MNRADKFLDKMFTRGTPPSVAAASAPAPQQNRGMAAMFRKLEQRRQQSIARRLGG